MTVVVADTGPINYLVQIGTIGILGHFFDQVILPKSVEGELLNLGAPSEVREWARNPPNWVQVVSARNSPFFNLDAGESEAISLAQEMAAFAVLLDDAEARRVAKSLGLGVIGTIGLLEKAAVANLVDLTTELTKLRRTNYRAPEKLLQDVLARHANRSQ